MLNVSTSTQDYEGHDALDVSRQSGSTFAPSWRLLKPFLAARKNGLETEETRQKFADAYLEEMRAVAKSDPIAWKTLLAREQVTLCCYCRAGQFCHRLLLAGILAKLGARLRGERLDGLHREVESYRAAYNTVLAEVRQLRAAAIRKASPAQPLALSKRDARILALAMSTDTTAAERETALSALSKEASDTLKGIAMKAGK